ncbi:MAG: metalloregulator ArsR/SmtB family transcription factor [Clostridia bacterium]|nr:metalloregulator ArsR/SmtB family transcription factor [Clostridia bacterium]
MNGMRHDHSTIVSAVRAHMPDTNILHDLADLFKVFSDSTRMKIMFYLLESELCVCALADLLNMEQSAVSHQLRILKSAKLVAFRREGKLSVYYLADDHVRTIIEQGFEHLTEGRHE